ncbi:DivIVA domain-containing protein [Actinomadura spongiicola]|uniref:DivIVA domain-containing protein n=1 Tax=Actinomadura spongiicola TaxID=2303421 RepID=A0A372GM57_9ACTN|nr:DivIVA domain-containing protein [Actinomadura spongiicola]RFS86153.1 DivIVA domain-containing protein [Actinomadura spongiicola]
MISQRLGPERVARLRAFESGSPPPFRIKMRGYDRLQVENYLRGIAELVGAENPVLEPAAFDIVIRGYDIKQVDAFLAPLRLPRN